jgi:hypothetical protein
MVCLILSEDSGIDQKTTFKWILTEIHSESGSSGSGVEPMAYSCQYGHSQQLIFSTIRGGIFLEKLSPQIDEMKICKGIFTEILHEMDSSTSWKAGGAPVTCSYEQAINLAVPENAGHFLRSRVPKDSASVCFVQVRITVGRK